MMRSATPLISAAMLLLALTAPAVADYGEARARYQALPEEQQLDIAYALIASGDFEGLAEHGFTRTLYRAITAFEREGFTPDGVLDREQRARLKEVSQSFYAKLGNKYYTHPVTGARLLVPRRLFDQEKPTPEGMLFSRRDGMFSLIFLSFRDSDKSFDELWDTLTAETGGRRVIYERRFASHFVATGFFKGRKFYTWMARTGNSTTGFSVSWGAPWEETGRKVSTLLANAFRTGRD
jgi:hypothetical protein